MLSYQLTIGYSGLDIEDFDQLDAIGEYLPTATVIVIDGQHRVKAVVEAITAMAAADILVEAMSQAVPSAMPLKAEFELVNVADIAALAGVNRETARLWIAGKRGPGDFPAAVSSVGDRSRVWAARDVYEWLGRQGYPHFSSLPLSMDEVVDVNRSLRCQKELAASGKTIRGLWTVVERTSRSGIAVSATSGGRTNLGQREVYVIRNIDAILSENQASASAMGFAPERVYSRLALR